MMQSMNNRLFSIVSLVLVTLALAACGGVRAGEKTSSVPSGSSQAQSSAAEGVNTVHGVATNFAFSLDSSQVSAGPVTFVIENNSPAPHDFAIEGQGVSGKTAMIQPGERATITLDLPPGTYTYICTVPGHAMLGMEGVLTVR